MPAHWKLTSAKCHEYIDLSEPHKVCGRVVEENGVYAVWFLSKDGNFKKGKETLPNLRSAQIAVEGMVENPNVAKL